MQALLSYRGSALSPPVSFRGWSTDKDKRSESDVTRAEDKLELDAIRGTRRCGADVENTANVDREVRC